jgi:glycosyltransferase involved in cell wall biosynthesis
MRVLYVDSTSLVSGAQHSLLDLLTALDGKVAACVAAPDGPLLLAAGERRAITKPIPGTDVSFKLHPWHTSVALVSLARAASGLVRAARRSRAELIHANSIRGGLVAIPAALLLRVPLIVHVRDVLPSSRTSDLVRRVILRRADALVANSRHTARAFDPSGRARRMEVIDNPIDLTRFDSSGMDRERTRERLGVGAGPLLGVVGQVTPWKGQEDAIRALPLIRRVQPGAQLLVVGEPKFVAAATRFDNRAYEAGLHAAVEQLGLDDAVRFLGERDDVPEIMHALDLCLVPSWDEPFGRTVVEAMAVGTPVIATSVGGPGEIIEEGRTGFLVEPRSPELLAARALELLQDDELRSAVGRDARSAVTARFAGTQHVDAVLRLYRELVGGAGSDATRTARVEPVEQTRDEARRIAAATWRVDVKGAEIRVALDAGGVPMVLLKGRAFADLLYAGGPARHYVDCDLLVPPSHWTRASETLRELGFSSHHGMAPSDLSRDSPAGRAIHGNEWLREEDGFWVDLHQTLPEAGADPQVVWSALQDHVRELEVGGVGAQVLDAAGSALLAALHVAHHGPDFHGPLRDLERAVQQLDEACWRSAASLAAEIDAEGPLGTGLRFTAGGSALADRLGLPWAPTPAMLLGWDGAPWGATVWESLASASGTRARSRLLAALLFPSAEDLRARSPIARRGAVGLIAARVALPFELASRAAPSLRSWRRGRRQAGPPAV